MNTRKRKSREAGTARPNRMQGLLNAAGGLLAAAGAAALRHRRPLSVAALLLVVFSFVAANAVWYQPGRHPSPFLATRAGDDPHGIAGLTRREPPAEVTEFRFEQAAAPAGEAAEAAPAPAPDSVSSIRRPDEAELPPPVNVVPARRPFDRAEANAEDPVARAIREAGRTPLAPAAPAAAPGNGETAPVTAASDRQSAELVAAIQRGLANIAYGDVTVDGIAGARTRAAIRRFERHYRLPETGEPNAAVLAKLKAIGAL